MDKLALRAASTQEPAGVATRLITESASFWAALRRELDAWGRSKRNATFLLRDDDATEVSPALHRLLAFTETYKVPCAIAAIPAHVSVDLAAEIRSCVFARIVQHGYAHKNHARMPGEGAWELGAHRPEQAVLSELVRGRTRLAALFGRWFMPVLVPPWNRIAGALVPRLPALGYIGLSAAGGRARREPAPGLIAANIHWDLLDWKKGACFRGYRSAQQIIEHLRLRRLREVDPEEPTGLLTHHLVMDPPAWIFLERFLALTTAHEAAAWHDLGTIFGTGR